MAMFSYLYQRIVHCDALIQADPTNDCAYYAKAKRLRHLEILTQDPSYYEQALACYTKAIDLRELPKYLLERSRVYIHMNQLEEAVKDLIRIDELSDDPFNFYVQKEKIKMLHLDSIQNQIKQLYIQGKITDAIFTKLITREI